MRINSMKLPLKEFVKKVSQTSLTLIILMGFAILIFSFVKSSEATPNSLITKNYNEDPEVKLTVLNSMERIGQSQTPFGELRAIIKGARNEVISFQLVVSAVEKNIQVNKVEVSDLTKDKDIIGKGNMTLFREEYVRVRQSFPRAKLPPGLYTDPLVPFIDSRTGLPIEAFNTHLEKDDEVVKSGFHMYGIPFDVWKGENQPIWVDISIPKDAVAGKYEGVVTIQMHGALTVGKTNKGDLLNKVVSIPVTLTVWNFTLPDGSSLRNHFGGVESVAPAFKVDRNSDR